MIRTSPLLAALLLGSSVLLAGCPDATKNRNISTEAFCFSGGTIRTADDNSPTVEAVAIKDGLITYAGPEDGDWCETHAGKNIQITDLDGAALYPGFTDAHGHLLGIGLREMTLNLEGSASIDDLQNKLKVAVDAAEPGETIYGRGWIETFWPEKRFPTRQDLDAVSPDNPVILERSDGHAVVVNSVALNSANITGQTEAPFGGAINLDAQGEPTGMLIDNAGKLVDALMPDMTMARKAEAYIKGSELYASRGWTNIHSMSVDPSDVPLLNRLADEGKLKIRVYNSLDLFPNRASQTMASITKMRTKDNPLVTTRAIKLYADGALGSRGAALLAPYSDDEKNSGLMLLKQEQAESILDAALRDGTQVNTHAIGDKANRMVLDWYEAAYNRVPKREWDNPDPRWRIEHSQIINPADIPRFVSLNVIPSMQPSHAIGDLYFAPSRLGPDRLAGAYAWRALIDEGAIIAGGSDAPVEVGDPRIEFYAATQRMGLDGFSNEDWNREQRVTNEEALKMFTAWPAYAAFQEDVTGQIKVGLKADLTAFKSDLFTVDGADILTQDVAFTMVGGKLVFDGR